MLHSLGFDSMTALMEKVVPASIRPSAPAQGEGGIGAPLSEAEVLQRFRQIAEKNKVMVSMIGQGYYDTFLPPVILRNVLENPAWYTAYTPYQPEISQGRLEVLLNFQTLVTELTGLDIANASLLDEATACAEAMAMARRISKSKTQNFFVDEDTHPQIIAVMRARAIPQGWTLIVGNPQTDLKAEDVFGGLFSYPGSSGEIRDPQPYIEALHQAGNIACLACDPLALMLLKSPGALKADIAVGSMQRFGTPMGNGGPHAAFMATKDAHKRHMPGRIVGISRDSHGRPAYRLSLQTREQHIRREKATSNICTAQALPAMISTFYALYHGPEGLSDIANRIHHYAGILRAGLKELGFVVETKSYFDTITVSAGVKAPEILQLARKEGINLRDAGNGLIGVSCDELTTPAIIKLLWQIFGADEKQLNFFEQNLSVSETLPSSLKREGAVLTHSLFKTYQSETEMMRYLRRLADKDLALDRSMIPLGSCTMKLNPTTAMEPITWPEFAQIHPFAPNAQKQGYAELFTLLEEALCHISGYDAVSLQPNSGAQGEFAGLMAIRAYHEARGEKSRSICLIPASAHGTNPASAQMAGMDVVVVSCDESGNVDVDDLKVKLGRHEGHVAAIMITYPSTHGVFEEKITEICDLVHQAGGQVYLDGANMNAQVGLARPGRYGADVSHFNLHKTFCIPHGGGGPGMGPIGVKAHLAPYLPSVSLSEKAEFISGAPYGSASVLPISLAYILMMGDEGLRQASEVAILNANYIARRLEGAYEVLFRGAQGLTAHECILDMRPFKDNLGVTIDDFAKRLIDYGFHAPTVSFPVPGTLMIEPTESEDLAELNRFCEAMLAIREEISAIEEKRISIEESPLRHAPHTPIDLVSEWQRSYSREEGAYPEARTGEKYWPPVGRIDNAWGDRNLVCTCPDIKSYEEG